MQNQVFFAHPNNISKIIIQFVLKYSYEAKISNQQYERTVNIQKNFLSYYIHIEKSHLKQQYQFINFIENDLSCLFKEGFSLFIKNVSLIFPLTRSSQFLPIISIFLTMRRGDYSHCNVCKYGISITLVEIYNPSCTVYFRKLC